MSFPNNRPVFQPPNQFKPTQQPGQPNVANIPQFQPKPAFAPITQPSAGVPVQSPNGVVGSQPVQFKPTQFKPTQFKPLPSNPQQSMLLINYYWFVVYFIFFVQNSIKKFN